MNQWHQPPPEAPDIYIFPEKDLMDSLMSCGIFFHVHPFIPLLHRQTFEQAVAEGLHLRNGRFGATLLLYSDDPRVFLEGTNLEHSCGWKWAGQIRLVKQSFTTTPSLYDVQICCLAVVFLQGTGCPELCWVLTSIGIRLAQDVGAHRRSDIQEINQPRTSYGRELSVGQPTSAFRIWSGLPARDKGYWSVSTFCSVHLLGVPAVPQPMSPEPFKQPPGIPSQLAYLNCYIKLLDILGFAQRTLYTLKRSKKRGAEAEQWNHQVVAELEQVECFSAMVGFSCIGLYRADHIRQNNWIDSLPDHLRWDPHRENFIFSQQSASLYASYYHVANPIHRPFHPSPGSFLAFLVLNLLSELIPLLPYAPTLHDLVAMSWKYKRVGYLPLAHVKMALFDSSVILLLIVWSGKQNGMTIDASKEIRDVHTCLNILRSFERRNKGGKLQGVMGYHLRYAQRRPISSIRHPAVAETGQRFNSRSPSVASMSGSEFAAMRRGSITGSHDYSSPGAASTSGSDLSSLQPRSIAGSRRCSPLETMQQGQGMDGWSTPFAQQPDQDASIEKILPSDFFSSVLDNTLGAAEGENPEWTYAPATGAQ
ncbi:hypothetical protein B0H13DRAFT_1863616 [Mycena leptocephala]|nr:hypothetical protein B0H13DRAFT_1863616 [Mycena leptocephala]